MERETLRFLALAAFVNLAFGCVGDAFTPTKALGGGYDLVQFEGDSYFVAKRSLFTSHNARDVDPLEGYVQRVGWTRSVIVFSKVDFSGNKGWIIINLSDGRVDGPLTESAFSRRRDADPAIASLPLHSPAEAWRLL